MNTLENRGIAMARIIAAILTPECQIAGPVFILTRTSTWHADCGSE